MEKAGDAAEKASQNDEPNQIKMRPFGDDPEPEEEASKSPKELIARKEFQLNYNWKQWTVILELIEKEDSQAWLEIKDVTEDKKLIYTVNMSSPFMRQFGGKDAQERESILRLAAGIALSQTIATEQGAQNVHFALDNLNQLLEGELSKPNP